LCLKNLAYRLRLVLGEEMRNEEIINEIRKIVENACKKETNYFGYGIWTHTLLRL